MARSINELYARWQRTGLKDDWEAVGEAAAQLALLRASVWSNISQSIEYDFESLAAAALFGAAKAVNCYDPSKASLFTFVVNWAEHEMQHYFRDECRLIRTPGWLYESGAEPIEVLRYDGFKCGQNTSFEDFVPAAVRDVSWYDSEEWDAVLEALEIVADGGAGFKAAKPLGVGMNKMQTVLPMLRRYLNDEAEDPYAFDFAHHRRISRR